MPHRATVGEIAAHAGVSTATVDRVLHHRGGVRAATARLVLQSVEELERQPPRRRSTTGHLTIDVVMHAPQRFSSAVRAALEAELWSMRPIDVKVRFHLRERGSHDALLDELDRIRRRGSGGVVLKGADVPGTADAIDRLVRARIPVVTFVTDVAASRRAAYVGIDNRAAGATAAYLVANWVRDRRGSVLVTLSSAKFRAEDDRASGFRSTLRRLRPELTIVGLPETEGLDATVRAEIGRLVHDPDALVAVYSAGGGNRAIVEAFEASGTRRPVVIAHDLDEDNLALLRTERIAAVLHHDLHQDVRTACRVLLAEHGLVRADRTPTSNIVVITPFNVPQRPQRGSVAAPENCAW